MAFTIDSIDDLKQHLTRVMQRADHHAQNVFQVVLPLVGLILWKSAEVKLRSGSPGNMIWFTTHSAKRYAVVFNHDGASIEIKDGGIQGPVLLSCDNTTPLPALITFFENLP